MDLSLQQKTLGYAALHKDTTAPISYKKDPSGQKFLSKTLKQEEERLLLKAFYQDPKETLWYCRSALQKIAGDKNLSETERKERIKRYIDQYLNLILQLDKDAFGHSETKVYNWIPNYIPNNFVDMWSDSELSTEKRGGYREKIIIDKKQIFEQEKNLFYKIFSSPSMTKQEMINEIFHVVNIKKYDHDLDLRWLGGKSIRLDKLAKDEQVVCRHKALLFQVLAQACGLTSRLLKCNIQREWWGGSHVANLVRLDNKRYLLDTTTENFILNGKKANCIVPIEEKNIDLNKYKYYWEIKNGERIIKYTSRNNRCV